MLALCRFTSVPGVFEVTPEFWGQQDVSCVFWCFLVSGCGISVLRGVRVENEAWVPEGRWQVAVPLMGCSSRRAQGGQWSGCSLLTNLLCSVPHCWCRLSSTVNPSSAFSGAVVLPARSPWEFPVSGCDPTAGMRGSHSRLSLSQGLAIVCLSDIPGIKLSYFSSLGWFRRRSWDEEFGSAISLNFSSVAGRSQRLLCHPERIISLYSILFSNLLQKGSTLNFLWFLLFPRKHKISI